MAQRDKVRVHLFISGIVQGVNFRYYTRQKAQSLGITGWVRNLPDGRVEVLAEGENEEIERFVEWCRRGPPSANVQDVSLKKEKFKDEFSDFRINYGWI